MSFSDWAKKKKEEDEKKTRETASSSTIPSFSKWVKETRGVGGTNDAYAGSTYKAKTTEDGQRKYVNVSEKKDYISEARSATKPTISTERTTTAAERTKRKASLEAQLRDLTREKNRMGNALTGAFRGATHGVAEQGTKRLNDIYKQINSVKAELEDLEKPDTISSRQQIYYELSDIEKKRSAAQTVLNKYGSDPRAFSGMTDAQITEMQGANRDLVAAKRAAEILEREAEQIDYVTKYMDTTNDDTFTGQFAANYRMGRLGQDVNEAFNRYLNNPSDENRDYAFALAALEKQFAENNADALDDDGAVLPWISKSAANYLPQFWDQTKAQAAGALAGSLVGHPLIGASAGSALESYSQMRGAAYRNLIDAGVDEETALAAANDEAFISALIEGGSTYLSWIMLGGTKALNAIGSAAAKSGSQNIAVKTITNLFGDATGKAAQKAAAEAAKTTGRRALEALGGYALDVAGEGLEEVLQEAVSIGNEQRPGEGKTELLKAAAEALFNKENRGRIMEAGTEGAKVAAMFGGAQAVINTSVSEVLNSKAKKMHSTEVEMAQSDPEVLAALIQEGKDSGEGTGAANIAAEVEAKVQAGETITQQDVERMIAANEVYIQEERNNAAATAQAETESANLTRRNETVYRTQNAARNADMPNYGENGMRTFMEIAETSNEPVGNIRMNFESAYQAGLVDTPESAISFANVEQKMAYNAGRQDYLLTLDRNKQNGVTIWSKTSGLVQNELSDKLDAGTQDTLHKLGKATGTKIIIDQSLADTNQNGYYKGGEIHISPNAENPVAAVLRHELTHHLQASAPEAYVAFRNYAVQKMNEGLPYGGLTSAEIKQQAYAEQDVSLTTEDAMDEVAAQFAERILSDETAMRDFVNEIAGTQETRTWGQKIFDAIHKFIEKVKRVFGKKQTAEADAAAMEEYGMTVQQLEKAEKLWKDAVREAVKATKNAAHADGGVNAAESVKGNGFQTMFKLKDSEADSVKEQLRAHISELNAMDAVANVTVPTSFGNTMADARKWIVNQLKSTGYQVDRKGFGTIVFDEKRLNTSLNYINSKAEIAAYAVLPRVLKRGIEIGRHVDHKGRAYGTVTFAAPVILNGKRGNMAAVVKMTNQNGYKIHRILMPDGTAYELESTKKTEPTPARGVTKTGSLATPISSADASVSQMGNTVKAEAEEMSDRDVKYSLRKKDPPKKTGIAYKVFLAKDGELFPPMVANPGGEGTPVGVWLDADIGKQAPPSKTGRPQVQGGGKGTNSGKISLAFRPGWHLGDIPLAKQFAKLNKETGKKELFPYNFVWAECEYAMDVDYQEEAMSYGYTENGKFRHSYAGLPKLPEDGYYRYRTNPNPDTVPWIITGAMRVKKVLTDAETDAICRENGVEPMAREGGPIDLAKFGIKAGDQVKYSPKDKALQSGENGSGDTVINKDGEPVAQFHKNGSAQFSLKSTREESKNLIAIHNLTAEKLKETLNLGGFPMPSIAIVKSDMGHEEFGDISVLFRKDTINPTDRRNKVYGGDAWTPTRPSVGYKVNEKARQRIETKVENLLGGKDLMRTYRLMLDDTNVDDSMNRWNGDFKRAYKNNDALKIAFLKDKGIPFKPVMKEHKYNGTLSNDALRQIVQEIGASRIIEAQRGETGSVMQFEPVVRKFYNEQMEKDFAGSRFLEKMVVDELSWAKVETILRDSISFFKAGRKKIVDDTATSDKLKKKFTKKLTAEYEAWLDELSDGIIEKRGIRNDKDMFAPSGNRRSFEQLYMSYNLDNIVKAMASDENQKGGGVLGTGNIFGASAKKYSSITEVKEDSGRLIKEDEETHKTAHDAFVDRLQDITSRMIKPGDDSFGSTLDAGDAAVDALLKGKTVNGILRELKTWRRFNATQQIAEDIYNLSQDIANAPTAYFEAKPRRAVGFDEVAAVVMPRAGNAELKSQLEARGVQVLTYNANKDGDRLKKINSVKDIRFSMKEQNDLLRENAKLKAVNQALREQFKTTRFSKVDKKALDSFAKKLLRDYQSGADIDDTRTALDDLYTYIANGEDGEGATWEAAYRKAFDAAMNILQNVSVVNDDLYREYKELRDRLRTTGITLDRQYADSLVGYDSISEFRKKYFGRIKLVKDGLPVDVAYEELASNYPGLFDAYEHTNPADQLLNIAEVLDSLQPYEENPYSYNMRESASWLANDIMERFFELPQAKPTFADKAERKLIETKIKDQKKLDKLREQKNARIAEIIAENREKVKRVQEKERQKRAEAVAETKEHYAAKEARMSESRKASVLRKRITKHAADLSQKLLRPSDKQHIPEDLRGTVAALLESINLESQYTIDPVTGKRQKNGGGEPVKRTQLFQNLKKQYMRISQESSMVVDPALLGDEETQGWFEQVIALGETRVADMNLEELNILWSVMRSVEHSITTANKVLSKAKFQKTTEWANAIQEETSTRRAMKGRKLEEIRMDLENPYTFFSHYGEAGHAIYRMLRNAQDHQQIMTTALQSEVEKIVDPKTVGNLEKETHEFTTERGEKLTLTTAHIMEIHELMKREQARDHLTKGGIVQPEIESAKIKRGTDSVLLTLDDLSSIVGTLTDEQVQIADALQKLTSTMLAAYGNEASMKAYGYKKFTGTDYWPIKSAREGVHSNIEKGNTNTRSIKNIGLAKSVIPHANNPLDIGGVFRTFSSHAADMIDYAAWLCPMEDANRLYNYEFRGIDGSRTGKTMKGLLDRVGGKGAQQYWFRLMEDIQNGIKPASDTWYGKAVDKIVGNVKGAAVGANIRVVIQQPTAIVRAAAVLSPADMAKGLVSGGGWKAAMEHSAIAQRKDMGGFDIGSPMQMSEILFDTRTGLRKFNDKLSAPAGAADAVTWGRIWNACEWAVKREQPSLKAGSEDFYAAVDELFTEVIDQTQVVDGVLQRAQVMRSGNAVVKQATAFMGEPTMSLNMVLRAYDEWRGQTDKAKRSAALKKISKTIIVLVATNAVNALAQSLIDAERDDDDEKKYWERVWAAFTGLSGEEESTWEKATAAVLNGNLGSGLNPLTYMPGTKDIISIFSGYDVTRMDADVMADIIKSGKTFAESISGSGKKTPAAALKEFAHNIARACGISATNIIRDAWGIYRSIAIETDNIGLLYEITKAEYNIGFESNSGKFIDLLYRAYTSDKTAYEKIYADMVESGIDPEKIKNGMETRMKKDQGVKKVEDLAERYLPPEQKNRYDRSISSMDKSSVWRSATDAQRGEIEADLHDLITESDAGKALQEKIDEGAAWGVDESEYLLYKLALDMVDQPNKSGEYGGTPTNEEKAAAIAKLDGLRDSEIAYLWDTEDGYDAFANGIDMRSYVEYVGDGGGVSIEKIISAKEAGIEEDTYFDFLDMLNEYDQPTESGKYGSFTQAEAAAAVAAVPGLTNEERAYLWQSVNKSWKPDKNPWK